MILNHFRAWALTAPPAGRAEGANALARAYLYSNLDEQKRGDALRVLTGFLDDPSPLVRQALAEALADSAAAPHHLVLALADDQAAIAAIVLRRSPVLSDAELIDCAAAAEEVAQAAVAARPALSAPVAAALAEIASLGALVVLARNPGASLPQFSIRRMIERHGADATLREALLARLDLPGSVRVDLVAATTSALSAFVTGCNWMSPERMKRVAMEERDKASLVIADASVGQVGALIAHLRGTGGLSVGFAFRVIMSGKIPLFEAMLSELAGVPPLRVAGLVARCGGSGFATLYRAAGLPVELLPAFRIALHAAYEIGPAKAAGAALSRKLIDRVIAACEAINEGDLDKLLVLLRRLESEAAREDARATPAPLILKAAPPLVLQAAPEPAPRVTSRPSPARREARRFAIDMAALEAELCAA